MIDGNEKIDEIYARLFKKAMQDGIISEDEQRILQQVKISTVKFKRYYTKAMDDEIIDENEAKQLNEWKSQIMDSAWSTADADAVISSKEASLLNLLLKMLKNLELEEF